MLSGENYCEKLTLITNFCISTRCIYACFSNLDKESGYSIAIKYISSAWSKQGGKKAWSALRQPSYTADNNRNHSRHSDPPREVIMLQWQMTSYLRRPVQLCNRIKMLGIKASECFFIHTWTHSIKPAFNYVCSRSLYTKYPPRTHGSNSEDWRCRSIPVESKHGVLVNTKCILKIHLFKTVCVNATKGVRRKSAHQITVTNNRPYKGSHIIQ